MFVKKGVDELSMFGKTDAVACFTLNALISTQRLGSAA